MLGMILHAYNPSIQDAEVGKGYKFEASIGYVSCWLVLCQLHKLYSSERKDPIWENAAIRAGCKQRIL